MPSVRIKRGNYSTLDDFGRAGRPQQPRTRNSLFNLWHYTQPTDEPTSAQQESVPGPSSPPTGAGSQPNAPATATGTFPPRLRPRAGSRVFEHIVPQSQRRAPSPDVSSGRLSLTRESRTRLSDSNAGEDYVTFEGPNTDIRVRSTGEPSLVGSVLSLPDVRDGPRTMSSIDAVTEDGHHHDHIVEHLDVIDPQVATVSNLTNAANSILIPPLSWYSRKPVVLLNVPSQRRRDAEKGEPTIEDDLDRHVDDVLRRRSKIKRTLLGIWSFLKTPMGILTGIYGFLVVFWGGAIVIFLAKIINFHNANTQGFWVEVSSQVTNGLFTVTGIGLIPSRCMDTYRICKIWYYRQRTKKLRKKAGLPQLFDPDDLPDPAYDPNYVHVLTEKEQTDLHRQQVKFQYQQTWYRAHGTETHRAFPINTALLICLFNDGNSIFQIILCATMWGLNRFRRPAWSTGILIPASFLCGIASAVFIARGSSKTKRTKEVEERLRAALALEYPAFEKDEQVHIPGPVATTVESPTSERHSNQFLRPPSMDTRSQEHSKLPSHPEERSHDQRLARDGDESLVEEQMTIPAITIDSKET